METKSNFERRALLRGAREKLRARHAAARVADGWDRAEAARSAARTFPAWWVAANYSNGDARRLLAG